MSIANNIKRAALGPTPRSSRFLMQWLGGGKEWDVVWDFLPNGVLAFHNCDSNDERRMFLLFVAYSLGAK